MAVADYPVGFVCKATLFKLPIMGTILRWANAIPVHRAQDAPAANAGAPPRAASNKGAFTAVSARLKQNGRVAIFPEGVSHMESHVMPLYTGITRMALDAVEGIVLLCQLKPVWGTHPTGHSRRRRCRHLGGCCRPQLHSGRRQALPLAGHRGVVQQPAGRHQSHQAATHGPRT